VIDDDAWRRETAVVAQQGGPGGVQQGQRGVWQPS
jgi:hypothetical protein